MSCDTMSGLLTSCLLVLFSIGCCAVPAPAAGVAGPFLPATSGSSDDSGGAAAYSPPDSTGTLVVRVVGLDSNDGTVRIELDTAQTYGRAESVRLGELSIRDRTAPWTLDDVPHGTYAVALYHDQNDNDELDTNFLGRPQESYGFSNDARGTMGRPDFEEAAFTLSSDSLSLTITAK